jgi:RNA polymerase sigma-70 factor, ECF subfamily
VRTLPNTTIAAAAPRWRAGEVRAFLPLMPPDVSIAAVLQGDRQATEALLRSILPRVRNVARALLGADLEVDDVAQSVLLQVLRGLEGFRGEGSLSAWVDRITIRVALGSSKRARFRRERESAAAACEVDSTLGAAADEYLYKREIAELLDALPAEQRQAVVLHHVLGLSVPELAAEQRVSLETARSRLRLGIGRLRAMTARRQSA